MFTKPHRDFIVKSGGKFQVKSHEGKVLGTHKTRSEALAQLRAVEYHKAHDSSEHPISMADDPATMGQLELPRGGDYQAESIGMMPEKQDIIGGTNEGVDDSSAVVKGGTDPGLNENPLQPHELPERHSNPHHSSDPLHERQANGEPSGETRYLEVEQDVSAAPGHIPSNDPDHELFGSKHDAPAVKEGGIDLGEKTWPECDPLGDLRAANRIGEDVDEEHEDQPGRPPREQHNAPPQAMRNGDPAPNPSAKLTIRPSATEMLSAAAPGGDEIVDEGDPNQYEMQSTESRLRPNEGNEPGYYEQVSGSNGGPDNAYSKTDPAGDDDFLRAIGAGPTKSGTLL